jgi:hypothetical protein
LRFEGGAKSAELQVMSKWELSGCYFNQLMEEKTKKFGGKEETFFTSPSKSVFWQRSLNKHEATLGCFIYQLDEI